MTCGFAWNYQMVMLYSTGNNVRRDHDGKRKYNFQVLCLR